MDKPVFRKVEKLKNKCNKTLQLVSIVCDVSRVDLTHLSVENEKTFSSPMQKMAEVATVHLFAGEIWLKLFKSICYNKVAHFK